MSNAMEKLARETVRVTRLLVFNESLDQQNLPQVNMKPIIAMERASIEAACLALGSNDPTLVMRALADLKDYES